MKEINLQKYLEFTNWLGETMIDGDFNDETAEELEIKYKELMTAIVWAWKPTFWNKLLNQTLDKDRISFKLRMTSFLSGYENKLEKLWQAVELMKEQKEGVAKWLNIYEESIEGVNIKDLEGLEQIEYAERQKIIETQKLTLARTERRLVDAQGTQMIMASAYSRYKTDLATAISEIGVARALNSALTTLNVFEKMTGETQDTLTQWVIEGNKKVLSTCQKVISNESARQNALILENNTAWILQLTNWKW